MRNLAHPQPSPMRRLTHIAYLVTILFKGFVGFLEMLGGLTIALTGPQKIYSFVLAYPVNWWLVKSGIKSEM